ncbi:MAG: TetR/AcrR family transcriptional regulator [Pseudomonadota bacterium]
MTRLSREILLPHLTAHVLDRGLGGASLRPLAKAAGTSDRMLIYHFGSKDALMAEILGAIAADLSRRLDAAIPARAAVSLAALADQVVAVARSPDLSPHFRIWLDILAGGQNAPMAGLILDGFLAWLTCRLPDDVADPEGAAAALLALIEGTLVLDAAGRGALADAARRRLLGTPG